MPNDLSDLLRDGSVLARQPGENRKQVLLLLTKCAGEKLGLDKHDLLDAVMERENLGSTGVGEGVAIPHARVKGLSVPSGFFVSLTCGVDFDAIDERSCDLIFMLLAPYGSSADHLRALARVSRTFKNARLRDGLRFAADASELFALLCPKAIAADAA